MSKIAFPWNKESRCLANDIRKLRVDSSCRIKQAYIGNDFGLNTIEKQANTDEILEIQLRQSNILLYDMKDEKVIDFFQCSLSVNFSVHEVKEFYQQSLNSQGVQQKTLSIIQFNHQNFIEHTITFVVDVENKKTLEQFGIALEKCTIKQKDFHRKFKPIRKLGKGRTASVFSALRLRDCSTVAIKAFNKSSHFSIENGKGKKALEKELAILVESNCQNVCQFQGLYETENSIYLVMKIYDQTLSTATLSSSSLQRQWVVDIMGDLLKGVAYLHDRGIMHRDLKLQNIMINNNGERAQAVIIDLGIAQYFHSETYLFQHCGTIGFVAPQIFGPKPIYPQRCDIFSLGVVFYMMLFKKPLFLGDSKQQIMMNNRMGKLSLDMSLIDEQDELIKDLLVRMLEVDNEKRISAREALKHSLFDLSPSLTTTSNHISNMEILSFIEV